LIGIIYAEQGDSKSGEKRREFQQVWWNKERRSKPSSGVLARCLCSKKAGIFISSFFVHVQA